MSDGPYQCYSTILVYTIVSTECGTEEVYGRSLEEDYAISPTSGRIQL